MPPSTGNGRKPGTVVALRPGERSSGLHQQRARGFIDDLLAEVGAGKRVRALAEQQIYFLLRDVGLSDALDLLRLCSPEQVQACLDLDCWTADRLEPERMQRWLEALTEIGPAHLGAVVAALDHELLVTFLAQRIRVYDPSAEEPPEEADGHYYQTPDRMYQIDVLPDSQDGQAMDRILECLYMADQDLARRVLMGARWDIGPETEETAYRFRSGRMADLGYVDYYDALRIYSFLDPRTVRRDEHTRRRPASDDAGTLFLPPELAETLGDHKGLFTRAMAQLEAADRAALTSDLLFLLNQVLSAERIDPGSLKAARPEWGAVLDTLSLALSYLGATAPATSAPAAPGEVTRPLDPALAAAAALRSVALARLFRLGHSLTLQVARLALILKRRGLTTLLPASKTADPASLLETPHAEVMTALCATRRPRFARALDTPPAEGTRPFHGLRDIALTVACLEELSAITGLLTTGLGLRLDTLAQSLATTTPDVATAKLTDLVGTMAGNLLLQRPAVFVPLARGDLPALRRAALGLGEPADTLSSAAEEAALRVLRERVVERCGDAALWTPVVETWLRAALARLGRGLRALPADLPGDLLDMVPRVEGLVLG